MIQAVMVDVDGVLVNGRPEDGRPWQTSIEQDFGVSPALLHEQFFAPHWEEIVLGRAGLMDRLNPALRMIAPHVDPATFVAYWFEKDARLATGLLTELAHLRAQGRRVYLATNQEHLRAAYLMERLGLSEHVDGMVYSARLGAKKPAVDFFVRAQAAVGLRGEELLLIDDIQANIDAARAAGWRAHRWDPAAPTLLRDLLI